MHSLIGFIMKTPFSKGFIQLAGGLLLTGLSSLLTPTVCIGQFTGVRTVIPKPKALPTDTFLLDFTKDIAVQLMSFDNIFELAATKSPLINYQEEVAVSLNSAYQLSKLDVLKRSSGYANYSTGNQAILSTGDARSTLGQITNGYRVGVTLEIGLADLLNRPHLMRQAKANYQAALMQKENIKLQLKHELITIYQDLVTAQQVLKVRIQDEQTALTAYNVTEAESRQGNSKPADLASIYSRYAEAKAASEEAKGVFIKNAYYLEALVGVSLQQLRLR